MSMNLKDDILKAVREAREFDMLVESFTTPKFRKPSPPPPPNVGHQPTTSVTTQPPNAGSGVQPNQITSPHVRVKTKCTYMTPCGWCTKWDKKCDKKPYKRGLRVLINPIDDSIGISDGESLINKICQSEEDHQWECCGVSTVGSDYRCKKCGTHTTVPYTTSTSNYYKGE